MTTKTFKILFSSLVLSPLALVPLRRKTYWATKACAVYPLLPLHITQRSISLKTVL